jgi:phosphonate transport system substrate-binding protein
MTRQDKSTERHPPAKRRKRTSPVLLLLAALVPVAVVATVLWFQWVQRTRQSARETSYANARRLLGLEKQARNALDPRFTDTNNDLVADAPGDPAQLVDPPTLYFSYVALEDPAPYQTAFADLLAHLSRVTGKKVEYLPVTTTNDQLKALRDGKLHVTGFNTGSVPIATYLCGFVPVCKLATSDGKATLNTVLIVPADSPVKSPSDLKGRELTLTEPNSNAGFKAPVVLLRSQFDLEPERDYIPRFSQEYDDSIKGIASKQYQAAAVASDVLDRAVTRGDISRNDFRVIFTSESFPTACFGYAYNLKPDLAEKVRQAFDTFAWPGTSMEKEFAQSNQGKFVPAAFKDDWSLIRRIDEQIGNAYRLD